MFLDYKRGKIKMKQIRINEPAKVSPFGGYCQIWRSDGKSKIEPFLTFAEDLIEARRSVVEMMKKKDYCNNSEYTYEFAIYFG